MVQPQLVQVPTRLVYASDLLPTQYVVVDCAEATQLYSFLTRSRRRTSLLHKERVLSKGVNSRV